jgi:hypothetical protein
VVYGVVSVLGSAFRSSSSSVCHDKITLEIQLGHILKMYIHTHKIQSRKFG